MSIPESQLETWSNQGATVTSAATHKSIRQALKSHDWPEGMRYRIYLQGSYANSTNIRGNSDVDVVVEATSVNYSNLTAAEKEELGIGKGAYGWREFREEVVEALREYYGAEAVDMAGSKSLKLAAGSGRLAADVVPCVKYKRYKDLKVVVEGITFWSVDTNEQIINYPKKHLEYGAAKNGEDQTNGWFKPTVRVFKNARERVIEGDDELRKKYPSYFIECLLYNASNGCFGGNFQDTFIAVVNELDERLGDGDERWVCQNGHQWLFGDTSVTWELGHAQDFLGDVASLWNNW